MRIKFSLVLLVAFLLGGSQSAASESLDVEISGYMQTWFVIDGGSDPETTFRTRRARMGFAANPQSNLITKLSLNVNPDNLGVSDAYFQWNPDIESQIKPFVRVGQFRKPFSRHWFRYSGSNPNMIDRAAAVGILSDWQVTTRDQGAMLGLNQLPLKGQAWLGVFNGAPQGSRQDTDSGKQLVARLEHDVAKSLSVGGNVAITGGESYPRSEAMVGFDAELKINDLVVVGEVFGGEVKNALPDSIPHRVQNFRSFFLEVVHKPQVGWHPGVRVERIDRDTNQDDEAFWLFTGQIGYAFHANARWQFNTEVSRSGEGESNAIFYNQFTVSF